MGFEVSHVSESRHGAPGMGLRVVGFHPFARKRAKGWGTELEREGR